MSYCENIINNAIYEYEYLWEEGELCDWIDNSEQLEEIATFLKRNGLHKVYVQTDEGDTIESWL